MLKRSNPLASTVQEMVEGGSIESLLGRPPEIEDIGETIEAEAEIVPPEMAGLAQILGPEGFEELEMAMSQFPVVREVANMATFTQDGVVEGMGGPMSDSVPANLSDGEYVFSAAAVDVIGLETLETIHQEAKQIAGSM